MEFRGPTLKSAIRQATAAYKKPSVKPAHARKTTPHAVATDIGQARAEELGAIADFERNYRYMIEADMHGADKYFHCVANC